MLLVAKDGLTATFLVAYLVYLDWRLTAFVIALFPITPLAARAFLQRLRFLVRASHEASDRLASLADEAIAGWRTIRLHDAAAPGLATFRVESERLRRLSVSASNAASVLPALVDVLATTTLKAKRGAQAQKRA